jgi:hypothetical protein
MLKIIYSNLLAHIYAHRPDRQYEYDILEDVHEVGEHTEQADAPAATVIP